MITRQNFTKFLCAFLCFAILAIASSQTVMAQKNKTKKTPKGIEPIEEVIQERTVLRILTSNDFPPFNYYDEEGNLSGFHIDLANALCREMAVRCDIRVTNWDNMIPTFQNSDNEAIIAGLAINKYNLSRLDFTHPYLRMPGRFAVLKRRPQPTPTPRHVAGKKVGVIASTAHDSYLRKFFKDAKITTFSSQRQATAALQKGEIDYLFGDAIQIMFWLNGSLSKQCCAFKGGPYWDPNFFGEGLAIAINKDDMRLRIELNDALRSIRRTGQFEELMLRYFPLKIY